MKKKKKYIIILVMTLVIIFIVSLVLFLKESNNKENSVASLENSEKHEKTDSWAWQEIGDNNSYYTIKNILNSYIEYVKQINGDQYLETGKLNMSQEEAKEEIQKEMIDAIEGILDETYKNDIDNIQKHIVDYHEKYKILGNYSQNINYELKIEKLYRQILTKDSSLVLVKAKLNGESFNCIIKEDDNNRTYSIFLEDFMIKNNYNPNMNEKDIKINEEEIKANGYNHFVMVKATDEYIVSQYFSEYKVKMLNNPESAYQLLNEEYRKEKYNSVEEFNKYIYDNKNKIKMAEIDKYQTTEFDGKKEYICLDKDGKYYIFIPESLTKYKVILDTYTVDLPEFLEKYNKASDEKKVGYNIQKIVSAINDGDYEYVSSKLDETFRKNNFETTEKLQSYLEEKLYEVNEIEYTNVKKEGDIYIYQTKIKNKKDENAEEKNVNFIMKLEEGTDFVFSFSIE